uniref:Uncharacterized protein n=1 Tax=Phenylobacterium glaciei TaxID=2803784 RepID=A0A974P3U0_9CAUL|nr:hypothetical protein JKL49_27435 [Phenylobacterium glaciei]
MLGAARADLAGARVRGLRMTAKVGGLNWTRRGGDRVAASLATRVSAEALTTDKLVLTGSPAPCGAQRCWRPRAATWPWPGPWRRTATGRASARPRPATPRRSQPSAPLAALTRRRGGSPSRRGGRAEAGPDLCPHRAPHRRRPGDDSGPGLCAYLRQWRRRLHLAVSGGGLPQADLAVDRYRFNAGGLTAQTRIKVKTGIGPVRDGAIAADGQLRVANGAIAFTASHCAPVSGRLELGANSVEAVETQLCPTGAPLFTLAKGDWHIRADAKALSAKVPFLQAAISQGAGRLDLGAIKGRLAGTLALTSGTVADTGADLRFNPSRPPRRPG